MKARDDEMGNKTIRLQKLLSERGVASRRAAAQMIEAGRVRVNGDVVTEPGYRVAVGSDAVSADGATLPAGKEEARTIMLYKPRGYICSASARQGRTVYDLVRDVPERIVPVGRLDKNSEGLLLMSNDGDLIHELTHPRFDHAKTYEVTVSGTVARGTLRQLRSDMLIDGYRIRRTRVRRLRSAEDGKRTVLEFVLKEGRNRQVRRMCAAAGLRVHRLVRCRVGGLSVSGLQPGAWKNVDRSERLAVLADAKPEERKDQHV